MCVSAHEDVAVELPLHGACMHTRARVCVCVCMCVIVCDAFRMTLPSPVLLKLMSVDMGSQIRFVSHTSELIDDSQISWFCVMYRTLTFGVRSSR